jgi:hypothetical protein
MQSDPSVLGADDPPGGAGSGATLYTHPVKWSNEHEGILVDWADKALCYKWMHEKSHYSYNRMNTWFTIPVIIMSTLTGTANFAQDKIPAQYLSVATMAIGGVNLIAGILTTIQQFLKIGELNESHRVSAISWGKFYRNVRVELAKAPEERTPVVQMLKFAKEEFDRLIETSPSLSDKTVKLFKSTFAGSGAKFNELSKPEICDSLESTAVIVYKAPPLAPVDTDAWEASRAASAAQQLADQQRRCIQDFVDKFEQEVGRPPTLEEVENNLESNIPLHVMRQTLHEIQRESAV